VSAVSTGRRAEQAALRFLERKGHRLLAANYRSGPREIDLITADGGAVVFTEVKARSGTRYGTPGEFVTRAKRRNLTLAAQAYLMEHDLLSSAARFDVVEVYLSDGTIHHIENAFFAED